MLTAVGLSRDPTMGYFVAVAARMGAAVQLIDLGVQVAQRWRIGLPPDHDSWVGETRLDREDPVYCRLIDLGSLLPTQAVEWHSVVDAWGAWLELQPAPVVNRPGHPGHNACKPLHEAFLRQQGFAVPASLATSSAEDLRAFAAAGAAIAKPLSGQRADCRQVSPADFDDFDVRSGPVYVQRMVSGTDVRAHVIGTRVIAQAIRSDEVDYRLDRSAKYQRIDLDRSLQADLIAASVAAGLPFAGWDLRLDEDTAWVFEVNPMPGYHHYDGYVDGDITRALLTYLMDGEIAS
jgi:hypothetical protein